MQFILALCMGGVSDGESHLMGSIASTGRFLLPQRTQRKNTEFADKGRKKGRRKETKEEEPNAETQRAQRKNPVQNGSTWVDFA